jgi:hypothetical protein
MSVALNTHRSERSAAVRTKGTELVDVPFSIDGSKLCQNPIASSAAVVVKVTAPADP